MTFLILLTSGFILTWLGYQKSNSAVMIIGVVLVAVAAVHPFDAGMN